MLFRGGASIPLSTCGAQLHRTAYRFLLSIFFSADRSSAFHLPHPVLIQVDKKLLGGFVIEFPDRRVDMSTAKKHEEFNTLVAKLEADLK